MKLSHPLLVPSLFLALLAPAEAQNQTVPGSGNQNAIDLSNRSPMVRSAMKFLVEQANRIDNPDLRKETLDAITNPETCIRHRAGLTDADKDRIVQSLINAGLINPWDGLAFSGGLKSGVFPPVLHDGSACPHLPQRFSSAPGSAFGGHHSYPGGLPIHEANNDIAGVDLANEYRKVYGHSAGGLAVINPTPFTGLLKADDSDIFIDQDIILGAPIWHDWAKALVFQWNSDGSEFIELNFGGSGANDNNGAPGDSRTGAHHILSIAEAMKRGLSPAFTITQASAHSAPTSGNEFKVVNWLRAAAIVAQIDPVQKGYLTRDAKGNFRLPSLRKMGSLDLMAASPSQTNLLAEYVIHNLSDADFPYSGPAAGIDQVILQKLAPEFGFNSADTANYNNHFRNPVLSFMTAERLLILYSDQGLEGVRRQVQELREHHVL